MDNNQSNCGNEGNLGIPHPVICACTNSYEVFMSNDHYCRLNLTKIWICWHTEVKLPNITFNENIFSCSQVATSTQTNSWTHLTLWRKNPTVHRSTHNRPPPVPILSHLNPIHTPKANLHKIHTDSILPSTSWTSEWSLSFKIFPPKPCTIFFPLPCVPHALPTSFVLTWPA
jgi:hypothetical protein